jgi:curved DNA-binding protein CbpA
MTMNHFAVLEVSPDCSEEDIKRSFRRLALQHHPDKGGQLEQFLAINNAYEILRDPVKRATHARAVFGTVHERHGRCPSRHHKSEPKTHCDERQEQHYTSYTTKEQEEEKARKDTRSDRFNFDTRGTRKKVREERRSSAEHNAEYRKKQKEEEEEFEKYMRKNGVKRTKKKQSGESNAEKLHRQQAEKDAWKEVCRQRRREGEEAARKRAQLNAEWRRRTAQHASG